MFVAAFRKVHSVDVLAICRVEMFGVFGPVIFGSCTASILPEPAMVTCNLLFSPAAITLLSVFASMLNLPVMPLKSSGCLSGKAAT